MESKRRVILDSNFLFVPLYFKIDVFEEIESLIGKFEPVVLSTTIEELKGIVEKGSEKMRRNVNLALNLARRCTILNVSRGSYESNDDVIVRVAKDNGYAVATNDKNLRRKLRSKGVATIYVRERSKLELDGEIY